MVLLSASVCLILAVICADHIALPFTIQRVALFSRPVIRSSRECPILRSTAEPAAAAAAASSSSPAPVAETTAKNTTATEPVPEIPLIKESCFWVESGNDGPAGCKTHALFVNLTGEVDPIIIKTGGIGRQASGAVMLTRGETVLYTTASRDEDPKSNIDFLPLSVEHQERFSSVGSTSGSYTKRDGRPAEHEILTCRLIDRPIRPLITKGWSYETQLLSWVLSYDGVRSCEPLAITAAATALYISDIPLTKPVAGIMVGYIDGKLVLNPSNTQMESSRLHLTLAGTKDAVLMIEGAADFLPENIMIEAVTFGHNAIKVLCDAIEELGKLAGKEKHLATIKPPVEGLQERVDELFTERIDAMYSLIVKKQEAGQVMSDLYKAVAEELEPEFPEEKVAINSAFKDLLCRRMFTKTKESGTRCDGRAPKEIRKLDMVAGFLPRVHGSALFTRGETQAIATATLGGAGMKQRIDSIDGQEEKRFYLQYTFPPSCVGETGRVGAPSRREVGHGNLAERALAPTLPDEMSFPYAIRLESLITESHGSSSMASVCGCCLALMDAGVPIKKTVAGIAMGMLLGDKSGISDENAIILSDISGTEDALGTMDFKVAGDREGITTFQLDIKCEGLTLETMEKALQQAREGRLHILDEMEKALAAPRPELPPTVPRIFTFDIPPETVGKLIGPGGKQVRAIIEEFGLVSLDVNDAGTVTLFSLTTENFAKTEAFVKSITEGRGGGGKPTRLAYKGPEPEVGKVFKGKVAGIHSFGVFVELIPPSEDGSSGGFEALCHVSELSMERVRNCEGFVKSLGPVIEVKYLGKNEKGQTRVSRKAVLEDKRKRNIESNKRRVAAAPAPAPTPAPTPAPKTPQPPTDEELLKVVKGLIDSTAG